mmetsp:Transcript_20404/g.20802  ORF Transcript_20404/g.20802 Transcript_20404/m.20802 type:complete len:89 (+) Transcript_20404:164-430(+)
MVDPDRKKKYVVSRLQQGSKKERSGTSIVNLPSLQVWRAIANDEGSLLYVFVVADTNKHKRLALMRAIHIMKERKNNNTFEKTTVLPE